MILLARQILFNIFFYGFTVVYAVLLSFLLFLPKKIYFPFLQFYFDRLYTIEKYILGLDFEVRGWDNVPKSGSFLVAAKHESAYETFKIHILFRDPAIIHKRELALIPFFGWHMWKSGMIAIDRKKGESALKSIREGALSMKAQGRPIIIFPQGTRVGVDEGLDKKPYKIGIVKMQETTGLPIIPMAVNSGLYWPKHAFLKKPGKVIFEFMPAVDPEANAQLTLRKISDILETRSAALAAGARQKNKNLK